MNATRLYSLMCIGMWQLASYRPTILLLAQLHMASGMLRQSVFQLANGSVRWISEQHQ